MNTRKLKMAFFSVETVIHFIFLILLLLFCKQGQVPMLLYLLFVETSPLFI